jgi:hypothetical protein
MPDVRQFVIVSSSDSPDAAAGTASRVRGGAAKAALLGLVGVIGVDAVLIGFLRHGPEAAILSLGLWPVGIGCGVAYALLSRGRLFLRVVAILIGLAMPYVAVAIVPTTAPVVEGLEGLLRHSKARREERHLAFLESYLSEPRQVIFVHFPYVVVKGGYSLLLLGVSVRPENIDAVAEYLESSVLGRNATATFPDDFLDRYHSNTRCGTTDPYARGAARGYGDAPAMVVVDGVHLNREIARRWGYVPWRDPGSRASRPRTD